MKISPTNYILVSDSATEPLTLQEVKDFLRITSQDFDDILTPLIKTVRQFAEKIIGRDIINKTWKTYLDNYSLTNFYYKDYYLDNIYPWQICSDVGIEILKSKLQSISSIKYLKNNSLVTFSDTNYYITDDSDYSSIYLHENSSFPSDIDNRKQAVVIEFVSGYGASADDVPQALKEAMLYHIAALFDSAGDCNDCQNDYYRKLYLPYKTTRLLIGAV